MHLDRFIHFTQNVVGVTLKVLIELKGKLGQSSVNVNLNNSSSVNPLPLPYIIWKLTLS